MRLGDQEYLLHTTQVIDLQRKLAAALCDWQVMCVERLSPFIEAGLTGIA